MRRHGIRGWLLLAFLLLALAPLLGGGWYFLHTYENALRETVASNLRQIADKKYDQIDSFLQERYADITLMNGRPSVVNAIDALAQLRRGEGTEGEAYRRLVGQIDGNLQPFLESGDYYDLLLVDTEGNVLYSVARESDLGTNLFTGPYRDSTLAEGVKTALDMLQASQTLFAPYAPSRGRYTSFLVAPVLQAGRLIGAVALQFNWSRLESVVTDRTGLGLSGETVLAERDGEHVLFTGPLRHVENAAFRYQVPIGEAPVPMLNAVLGRSGYGVVKDYAHHSVLAAWRYLPALQWGMVVKIDTDEAFAPLARMQRITWTILTFLALVISGLAFYFGRTLANALQGLTDATSRMALGEFRVTAESVGPRELRELAASFNLMSAHLTELYAGLETKVQERDDEIAARKRAEAALTEARDAAEAANRAKSVFLANMSHELRTPLNAVLGFAQIMERDESLGEAHRRKLETINRSGNHLLALINDVLEISRIEAGRTTVQNEVFCLADLLTEVEEMIRVRAESKGLQFASAHNGELPSYVFGDGHHLRQVLINLLGNAVKYTDKGSVTLRLRADDSNIRFEVADTGIGIAEKDLPRIFHAFYQTDAGVAKGEGTGLGLTISREFVRLMGGEITVDSAPGKGSVFAFSLPLPEADAPMLSVPPSRVIGLAADQPPIRVLVAEDNSDNRELITLLLSGVGFEVRAVENGQQAIDCFKTWRPAFIWMDMRMPTLDGYEATKVIRSLPDGKAVKIAALTASAFREDRQAILAAGCDDMLTKPVDEYRLFRVMGDLLGIRYRVAEDDSAASAELFPSNSALDLSSLSAQLRAELANAAELLDAQAMQAIIERIRTDYPEQARAIATWVDAYRFDVVAKLCRGITNQGE
ncbi:MAG: ATP-binding protein [Methylococcaceae bacterium]|nr:ATP-binding protein [Methylococcaceae bacterium]